LRSSWLSGRARGSFCAIVNGDVSRTLRRTDMIFHLGLRTPQITAQQNTQVNTQTPTQIATQVTLRYDLYMSLLSARTQRVWTAQLSQHWTLWSFIQRIVVLVPLLPHRVTIRMERKPVVLVAFGVRFLIADHFPYCPGLSCSFSPMMYLHAGSGQHMRQIRKEEGPSPTRERGYGYGQMICVSAQPAPASLQ
jgi:hypothetical protein